MTLAQLLKAYRARYHLTQAQAARLWHVSPRSWETWERRRKPLSHLQRLLLAL
jgi:DNA-binding transcriptional regulator YiaG